MSRTPFPALRVEGGLLAPGLFPRVLGAAELGGAGPGSGKLPGREDASYRLPPPETVRQAASRAFDYLRNVWSAFVRERDKAEAEGRPLTGLTRERWLFPLFNQLGYGVLSGTPAGGLVVEEKAYPVSHQWEHVPMHLLGWGTDLDRRTKGVAGAAQAAPQSMLQELLNRTDKNLWGVLCNGQKLRLLRDSTALAGSAYVEFDLEMVFSEELFSDFVLLYRLVHATRLDVAPDQPPASCWLEKWRSEAIAQGERMVQNMRIGVEHAINTLGTGFLRHPANAELRSALAAGTLSLDDYHRAVLRLVYRVLFWFVAEDREVLLRPEPAFVPARRRYAAYFSSDRLRRRARSGRVDHHDDLWEAVRIVFTALGEPGGRPELAIPGIGGLFERVLADEPGAASRPDELDRPLEGLRLRNDALLTAVRHLSVLEADGGRRPVDFVHLDSEELGSVYEQLLEMHPDLNAPDHTFVLRKVAGNERKKSGSYYTPSSLTEALLDSALDPLLDEASATDGDAEAKVAALLDVTVCDPACGSGHFLVAAARRIARRVAQVRSGEEEPSPTLVRESMREVVSRCIHGVDLNPMAAELAKVSLWLESVEPGTPLAFLDANIRVGNSLLGTTPALIDKGIPKEAFKPIEGDEKAAAKTIERRSVGEAAGEFDLFHEDRTAPSNTEIAQETQDLVTALPGSLTDVHVQQRRLRAIDAKRLPAKRVADAWCAAFVQEKTAKTEPEAITQLALDWIAEEPGNDVQRRIADRVEQLTQDYRFFHWHIEFPHIFEVPADSSEDGHGVDRATGWRGGFTCVIGNPPWERVKLQEQEFFAPRDERIANASSASKRKHMIKELAKGDEAEKKLYVDYLDAHRRSEGMSHFLRRSGRYPLTGRGDINTYQVFAENNRALLASRGLLGIIVPTGIATDATTQYFFGELVRSRALGSLYDFENAAPIFPGVHRSYKFCLLTIGGRERQIDKASFAFFLHDPAQLGQEDTRFGLTPEEIQLLNPNTGTLPVFRTRRDAEITLGIYRRVPVLVKHGDPNGNPWGISFMTMFHMSNDSHLFHTREELESEGWTLDGNVFTKGNQRMLPLYEGRMGHQFNHRYAGSSGEESSIPELSSRDFVVEPEYWIGEHETNSRLHRRTFGTNAFLLGFRRVARNNDERTCIASFLPWGAASYGWIITSGPTANELMALAGTYNSFCFDYLLRNSLSQPSIPQSTAEQVAAPPSTHFTKRASWDSRLIYSEWVSKRVLELSYTAIDLTSLARELSDVRPPFTWHNIRRSLIRAELDAAYFHLYGVDREDVDYIMETFPIVKRKDEAKYGEYRTKRLILEVYDAMAEAIRTGEPYRTILDPPPGQGPRHPAREADGSRQEES